MKKKAPLMGMIFDKEDLAQMESTLDTYRYELEDYLKPETAMEFHAMVDKISEELNALPEDFTPAWFEENEYTTPRKGQMRERGAGQVAYKKEDSND
tara:strand:+ start:1401 stop:1691 length:291 start_codon:yes stop_codon:yes gene_type:complete